jgi:hypothetical protein
VLNGVLAGHAAPNDAINPPKVHRGGGGYASVPDGPDSEKLARANAALPGDLGHGELHDVKDCCAGLAVRQPEGHRRRRGSPVGSIFDKAWRPDFAFDAVVAGNIAYDVWTDEDGVVHLDDGYARIW